MARNDDRTEKPTPKRKRKARREGQIPKTPELAAWMSVLVITSLLPRLVGDAGQRVMGVLGQADQVIADPTPNGALIVLESGLKEALYALLPIVALIGGLSLVANVAQTGMAVRPFKLNWSRVSPKAGVKRLLSPQTLWQLVKELIKLALVSLLAYRVIDGLMQRVVTSQPTGLAPLLSYAGGVILGLVRDVAVGGLVVAVGDYAFQRRRINQSLKMTKHEVKEEHRQSEGAPEVKRALRGKQRQLSRMRMMAAVAGADVVITNPTHYAVALKYDPARGAAPRVVAKGADDVALRIRQEAMRHDVPVLEDPPLARAIFAACDLEAFVPPELYVAVARVLAFVFTLPPLVRASGAVHRRPTTALTA